jgi:hypothetical protein
MHNARVHHGLINNSALRAPVLALLFLVAPAALYGEDNYRAVFSEDLGQVTMTACFDGPAPSHIYHDDVAPSFTESIQANGRDIQLAPRYGKARLPDLPPNSCLRWRVNLAQAAATAGDRVAMRLHSGYLTNGSLWFWRDNERRSIRMEVIVPAGVSLSTPWMLRKTAPELTYSPAPTPAGWTSRIAVGLFSIERVPVPGTELLLAVTGNLSSQQRGKLVDWISESADSVAGVLGNFPQQEVQVLVVSIGPRKEAVPWAHVIRGGGSAVEFFVDETRPLEEFQQDWVATHELSHLLLPLITRKDRWLSEGLASYYQNVLRARDGRLTEKQAWQRLNSGFERGRSGTRGVMRVYWSGAAILLKADTRLRALTDGRQSLDTALAGLHECCFESTRSWRAKELFTELDRLTGLEVFSELLQERLSDDSFPDISITYSMLGVVPVSGDIALDDKAPWSRIRQDIMSGGAPWH